MMPFSHVGVTLFVALFYLSTVSGCATITGGGSDQKIKITSNRSGAAVIVDGQPCGVTPTAVALSRKTEHQVEIAYPGCETAHIHLERRLNPWLFGNIAFGGLIGLGVDICTDATHCLSPGEIKVNLGSPGEPTRRLAAAP
jgi:hypothetical protein